MENNNNDLKFAIYARKSSEAQDAQVQSIPDQIDQLEKYAREHGLNVVKTLKEAKSAKEPETRPIFLELLKDITEGRVNGILIWDISRLHRNPVDAGRIQWMLQEGILKIIRTTSKEYKETDNVLTFAVESGMANQFIIDLRRNTKRGLYSKAEKGWLPSRAPQGYLNDKEKKEIIKDPERFDMVRKMWDMMLSRRYSIPEILETVNEEWGYRTKKRSYEGDRPISQSELYRIFHSPFYYGSFMYNGKLYVGNHDPMVTVEEFKQVQALIEGKLKPSAKHYEFPFTGRIKCGHCGSAITAEKKRKYVKSAEKIREYTYYHCTYQKPGVVCRQPAITGPDLEGQIIKEIEKYTIPRAWTQWAIEIVQRNNKKVIEERENITKTLVKNLDGIKKKIANLTEMRINDMIGDDEFLKKKNELTQEITGLESRLNSIDTQAKSNEENIERAFNFVSRAKEKFTTGDLKKKREILSALGASPVLLDRKLVINPVIWLVQFEGTKKRLKKYTTLEPKNLGLYIRKNKALSPVSSTMGG